MPEKRCIEVVFPYDLIPVSYPTRFRILAIPKRKLQACKFRQAVYPTSTFDALPINTMQMQSLVETSTHLDQIKIQLKSEFIGLEEIIDQFIDAVIPWCTMGESQTRPLVVNLWGMTGVGKTSLVKRFLELWNKEESVIHFNMGSRSYSRDLLGSLEKMFSISGKPCVIIFDEFQHAKTLGELGKELENPMDRMIWQLLDDGKFLFTKNWFETEEMNELIAGLELCLDRGVKVEKGKVIHGWKFYKDIMSISERQSKSGDPESRYFLTNSHLNLLFGLVKEEFKFLPLFKDYIFQLDGEEILKLARKIEKKSCSSREMDFSKSLILVVGNLDEAFDMSHFVSADHNPDNFYLESKKITFSKIKEGLKERFRMEEIARLGNIHLIYPALNSQVFREFIDKELKEISARFNKSINCSLEYSASVKNTLFEEGVTASQGFRPLRSTIRYLIESSLASIFYKMTFDYPQQALVDMEEDELIVKINGIVEGRKTLHLPIRESKRKKMAPQTLAITAVHEAGHALVYAAVFGKLPKMTTITSSDYFSGGFVEGESMLDFDTYELIIRNIAVKMAGKKAEELVFGSDNQITFGCEDDVKSATRILVDAVRSGVLSNLDVFFENPIHGTGKYLPETNNEMDWVKAQLEKGNQVAEKILNENLGTYRELIKILLSKKTLNSDELGEALIEQGVNLQQILDSYPPLPDYKTKLENFLSFN